MEITAAKKKTIGAVGRAVGFYVVLSIIVYSLFSLYTGRQELNDDASARALADSTEYIQELTEKAEASLEEVAAVAKAFPDIPSDDIEVYGKLLLSERGYLGLAFLNGDNVEYRFGEAVSNLTESRVWEIRQSGELAASTVFREPLTGKLSSTVYCPIENDEAMDGVLVFLDVLRYVGGGFNRSVPTHLYCLAGSDGYPIVYHADESFAFKDTDNFYTYLYSIVDSESDATRVEDNVALRKPGTTSFSMKDIDYVAATVPLTIYNTDYIGTCIFLQSELLLGKQEIYNTVMMIVSMLAILLLATALIFFISRRINERKKSIVEEYDPVLGCNSYNRFLQEAQQILDKNRMSNFAVVYLSIKNYSSFIESFDKKTVEESLGHIANILKKSIVDNETFGHITDDRFVMMVHYIDISYLGEKLKIISALISRFEKLRSQNYTLLLATGVYLARTRDALGNVIDTNASLADMVNRAKIASVAHVKAYEKPFIIYDNTIGSTYIEETKIESKMSMALDNREFKLFFQPKYSAKTRGLESAEVLVRWYNEQTKVYQPPNTFIRIFETNGFIIKLDHYVFRETCVFLSEMTAAGQRTVPLSVNVSRATAIDPGFLDFYVKTKEEFRLPSGYITLEFTETFAFDSYEMLSNLIGELKKNGFLCSIDDFGVGYSAISILKELPADEIKVDKALLDPSKSPEKDRIILEGIYRMVNAIGLKLIQEGVETKEQLDMVVNLGCNIIQGYYYAKPMHTTDFIDFINEDKMNKRFGYSG